jgi:hypothetical protein
LKTASVIVVVALAAAACGAATPTPRPAAIPSPAPSSLPSPSLAPSSVPSPSPQVRLFVQGTVRESCGSIGGCAYSIVIEGGGRSWQADFRRTDHPEQLVATDGMPVTIEPGTYTVELSTHLVTDVILNGERKTQLAGRCVGTLQVVDEGFASIHGVFDGNTCVVEATRGSHAP